METREWFTFSLSIIIFIPRYPILENIAVTFVSVITKLVENSLFSLIVLWYLINSFGDGIACVARDCLTKISSYIDKSIFNFLNNLFASSNRAITFEKISRFSASKRWSDTHPLQIFNRITLVELGLSIRTKTDAYSHFLKDFEDFYCFLVHAFKASAPESLVEEVFSYRS